MEGPRFLKSRFDLHKSEEVHSAAERTRIQTGEKVPQRPESQIQNYLDRFTEIIDREDDRKKERGIEAIKKLLHEEYIIKEVPDSYFRLQEQIARERNEEYPEEITEDMKEEVLELLSKDQEASLDYWIDYLSSEDATYPDWAKYWAFKSMLKMSEYDKEKQSYGRRTKDTVAPFPDLNQEALATTIDYILDRTKGIHTDNPVEEPENEFAEEEKPVSDKDFQKLLTTDNFSKYYAFAIEHVVADNSELYKITEGEWRKFEQGSNPEELTSTIQGKGTGWCTAGKATAETQLKSGDFYVYYSQNDLGEAKIPRLAIRMNGSGSIGEVRGVAHKQEVDLYITDVLKEKMDEFGAEGELYKKKAENMKHLTDIDNRHKGGGQLTKDDLRFLYEIDSEIEGFGYDEDPRIEEMLGGRNKRQDLAYLFDCGEDQISLTEEEAVSGDIVFHYGSLDFENLTSADQLSLPESIHGDLDLDRLTSADQLTLPGSIGGGLSLSSITSADHLTLPESIGAYINLSNLTSAEYLTLPQSVGGNLDIESLTSAEHLSLPHYVDGYLSLYSLTSAEHLTLPEYIGGDLHLSNLISAKNLTLPKSIGGDIYLENLTQEDKSLLRKKYPQHADNIE